MVVPRTPMVNDRGMIKYQWIVMWQGWEQGKF
jgi:hypothetical protein